MPFCFLNVCILEVRDIPYYVNWKKVKRASQIFFFANYSFGSIVIAIGLTDSSFAINICEFDGPRIILCCVTYKKPREVQEMLFSVLCYLTLVRIFVLIYYELRFISNAFPGVHLTAVGGLSLPVHSYGSPLASYVSCPFYLFRSSVVCLSPFRFFCFPFEFLRLLIANFALHFSLLF